jgi:hypothetical protein
MFYYKFYYIVAVTGSIEADWVSNLVYNLIIYIMLIMISVADLLWVFSKLCEIKIATCPNIKDDNNNNDSESQENEEV